MHRARPFYDPGSSGVFSAAAGKTGFLTSEAVRNAGWDGRCPTGGYKVPPTMNAESLRTPDARGLAPGVATPADARTESWWQTVLGCLLAATLLGAALLLT